MDRFLIFCGVSSALAGLIGFVLTDPFWVKVTYHAAFLEFSDALFNMIRLFIFEGPRDLGEISPQSAQYLLLYARIAAPIALAGTVLKSIDRVWQPWVESVRLRWISGHTIILGAEEDAFAFVDNTYESDKKIVLIIPYDSHDIDEIKSRFTKVIVFRGEADQCETWQKASAHTSKQIILISPDDRKNIAAMKELRGLTPHNPREGKSRVYTHIADEQLRKELVSQTGHFASQNGFHFEPFSIGDLSARQFFQTNDFFYETWLRNFDCVHWLIFGLSSNTITFLLNFLTVSPFPKLEKPKFTFVCPKDDRILKDFEEQLSLCKEFVDWEVIDAPAQVTILSEKLAAELSSKTISSILISDNQGKELGLALHLRGRAQRDGTCLAPIYLSAFQPKDVDNLIFDQMTNQVDDQITSIGKLKQICDVNLLAGDLDHLAVNLHDNYLKGILKLEPAKKESHRQWSELDENFRSSNRRAANHAKTKLEYLSILGPLSVSRAQGFEVSKIDLDEIEILAISEHDSWMIDRLLSGWRHSAHRDDFSRSHTDLVPFDELTDEKKGYDRHQINRLLSVFSDKQSSTAGLQQTIRIGLIGHNHISRESALNIQAKLKQEILPKLLKQYPNRSFQFFTGLAPGSDLVMAETIDDFVKITPSVKFELNITRSMKTSILVEDYQARLTPQFNATLRVVFMDLGDTEKAKHMLIRHLDEFCENADIYDISSGAASPNKERHAIQASYMVSRPDIIIANLEQDREHGVFGTNETVERALQNNVTVIHI